MADQTVRSIVRGYYDVQKLRIQIGNRVVANWRALRGIKPGEKTSTGDVETQRLLKQLERDYRRLTDGLVQRESQVILKPAKFVGTALITSYAEMLLMSEYIVLTGAEKQLYKAMKASLAGVPVYEKFLKTVQGIGPAMAGVIISEIDIARARHPSSLWRYAGLDVAEDGRGRSRRSEHLVKIKYTDRNGQPAERNGITYNPFLKTKLIGVLGPSFIKQGDRSIYEDVYRQYKHRLETHPKYKDESPGRRHNMAVRYMIKMFLLDLYTVWRPLENLPASKPYCEAKQGIQHAA